ncbi:MAG: DUF333 domain-containing protein [Candidatus Hadarchaeum sp.]
MTVTFRKAGVVALFLIAVALFLCAIFSPEPAGIANPAAVYCEALGYKYVVQSTPQGERGMCQLPSGELVCAWQFLQGKVAQEYSYCRQQGYEIKVAESWETCSRFALRECAVCVLPDGREIEVTELMGLDFSCPGYRRMSKWVFIGLGLAAAVAAAVLSLAFFRKRQASTSIEEEAGQREG